MYVYVDMVIGLNFLVDLLLLLGTNRLAGFPPAWKRVLPAAILGGVYGGACLLPGFAFLGNLLWRLVFLVLVSVTAFGWNTMTWKRCGIFVLLSMALGGISVNIGRGDYLGLVASAVLMWLLCHISFGGRIGGREYIPIEIRHGERQVCLTALRDSGNTLRDPITGEQVLVIDSTAAEALTGMTVRELSDPLGSIGKLPGLRLIPYRAVGQPGGMLLAMRCHVSIGRKKGSAVVAFAPQNIGRGEGYRALTGGAIA